MAKNKKEIKTTGGGDFIQYSLSPTEQAVDALLSLSTAAAPEGTTIGLEPEEPHPTATATATPNTTATPTPTATTTPTPTANLAEAVSEPRTPVVESILESTVPLGDVNAQRIQRNLRPSRRTTTTAEMQRMHILKEQTKTQQKLFESIKKISGCVKESAEELRKIRKLKEEKLNILKEKMKRKQQESKENTKLILLGLEIKKKKLAIEEKKLHDLNNNTSD